MATEKSNTKYIDYLDEDPPISGQEWICVSFLSPEGVKNCKIRGFKFRGAFHTREEAEKHAKEIQEKLDPDFHVFVGEGFKWLPWDQDPETVENQEYHEKELNELMKSVKENLLLKKQHENERKKQKMQQAMNNNKEVQSRNKTKERLQKKAMRKKQNIVEEKKKDEKVIEKPEIKEQIEEIDTDAKRLNDEKKSAAELSDGIHKLQEVYAKLLEKSKAK